jgi:hypothetical protein
MDEEEESGGGGWGGFARLSGIGLVSLVAVYVLSVGPMERLCEATEMVEKVIRGYEVSDNTRLPRMPSALSPQRHWIPLWIRGDAARPLPSKVATAGAKLERGSIRLMPDLLHTLLLGIGPGHRLENGQVICGLNKEAKGTERSFGPSPRSGEGSALAVLGRPGGIPELVLPRKTEVKCWCKKARILIRAG